MNHQQNTMMEVREDFMTSLVADKEPTFRTAHFLKPIVKSTDELTLDEFNLNSSSSSSSSSVFEPKNIHFNVWRYPHNKWVNWVDELKHKYESVWKKAGIFEAIMSTKSKIMKNKYLVYGVAEKWCCETNTFVFPFGEATITLEDVMVLGGYSVIGDPVFKPLEDQEMKEVEQKLIIARKERSVNRTAPSASKWMDTFIGRESEIEHEAFLATWLSVFVFPHKKYLVKSSLFPIAILLARGNLIALAPAVLASLYNDLSSFKETIVHSKKSPFLVFAINIQSPFYLVQVWVWERFKNLQPQPRLINNRDPVLLRWHLVKPLKIDNVRLALDSAMDDFIWRPYVRFADKYEMFYPNDEILVPLKKDLVDNQMLSFVSCLRVSELVGFESIEQYLPHRVAMQFALDQDVPSNVPRLPRFNKTKSIAWKNYIRPLPDSDESLYFPSRFFEADVTTRYAKWWNKSVLRHQGFVKNVVPMKRCASSSNCTKGDNIVEDVPSGLTLSDDSVEDGLNAEIEKNIDADAPSSLPTKHNTRSPMISVEDCTHALEDDAICQSDTQTESYNYLSEASLAALELRISRLERVCAELKKARLLQ